MHTDFVVQEIQSDFMKKVMDLFVEEISNLKSREEMNEKAAIIRSSLLAIASKVFVYELSHSGLDSQQLWETYVACFKLNLDKNFESAQKQAEERERQQKKGFN